VTEEKPPPPLPGDFSESPFGKLINLLSWVLITTVLLFVTALPSIALFFFLHPDEPAALTNALVVALSLTLLGPALSAGMYSARAQATDESPAPFKAFWRGYRMNFFDVLRLWFPACVLIGLLTFAIGVAGVSGLQLGNIGLLALTAAVLVWALHSLTLSTFISMSPGGIARLGLLYIGRIWKVTLGLIAAMIIVAFIAAALPGGIFLVAVLSALICAFLYHNAKPMIADATQYYTVQSAAPHDTL